MKKIITLIAACGLLLGSCVKSGPGSGDETGTVTFKVTAVNSLGLTRGDIYTSTTAGTIPTMGSINVYAFMKNDGDGNYLFVGQPVELIDNYDDEAYTAQEVVPDGTFAAGDYKFIAVGRVASDGYTIADPVAGTTNFNDFSATIANTVYATAGAAVNVLFAGNITQSIEVQGANIEIDISRHVAGVFAYISDVPSQIGGIAVQNVRLVVSNASTAVNLGTGVGYSVLGSEYYPLMFDFDSQTVNNGVYSGMADVYDSADPPALILDVVDGGQIASNYALPVGPVTMQLQLVGDDPAVDGTENPLKTWNLQYNNSPNITLQPNVLVSIGKKTVADTTLGSDGVEGDTSEDGSGADDTPASLLTDETITVNILKDWSSVQDLTLVEAPSTQP